ncbi:MAG: stage V sporulation protein AA [Clostridiales bacterium]|jgi:stage V sporulation protein AA|nr:stage V sporulation protein AA [Clostridiales bacterium]
MDIYIKPRKKAEIVGRDFATLGDVAEVHAEASLKKRAENIKLLTSEPGAYAISVIEMIATISATLPGHTINNVGEADTMVVIKDKPSRNPTPWVWAKVIAIAVVLFVGSATAIMAFHTDSQLGTVFKKYYEIFFGHEVENPYIINIPYSIGLALGIMVFFNHFATGKKITREPTPIEVEMELYEQDVEDALIQNLNRQKDKEQGE